MTKPEEHGNGKEPGFQIPLTPQQLSGDHCFNDELKKQLRREARTLDL